MIFDSMAAQKLDDEIHVTYLLPDGNPPNDSVEEEDIEEDNDDA
jgi:hypothetical protein